MVHRAKPTKLKILQGNPGKRPLNLLEPEPEQGIPQMPEWLKLFPVAVEEWGRESTILDDMGIMTVADLGNLANRAYLASQIQQMAREIETEGRVAYTQKMDPLGNEIMEAKANPKAIQLPKLLTEYRQLGSLLGLDAPSRTKLKTDKPRRKSKAQEFRNRKNGSQA